MADGEGESCVLAIYDFRSKREYIYRTNRMREITGASEIIAGMFGKFLGKQIDGKRIRDDWREQQGVNAAKAYQRRRKLAWLMPPLGKEATFTPTFGEFRLSNCLPSNQNYACKRTACIVASTGDVGKDSYIYEGVSGIVTTGYTYPRLRRPVVEELSFSEGGIVNARPYHANRNIV